MNKADKCSAVCAKHTWAAVSSTQQQNSSTSQIHSLCNSTQLNSTLLLNRLEAQTRTNKEKEKRKITKKHKKTHTKICTESQSQSHV